MSEELTPTAVAILVSIRMLGTPHSEVDLTTSVRTALLVSKSKAPTKSVLTKSRSETRRISTGMGVTPPGKLAEFLFPWALGKQPCFVEAIREEDCCESKREVRDQ